MILEIGHKAYVALAYPDETLFFSTMAAAERPAGVQALTSLSALNQALARPDLELVICHPTFSAPWSLRHLSRSILSRRMLEGRSSPHHALGPHLLRQRQVPPVVVVDREDVPFINRNNLFLLDLCDVWLKRELPPDHWRVFMKTAHENLPTPRYRLGAKATARIAKLKPLSIGLPPQAEGRLPLTPQPKTADVFFAGRVAGSSTLRERGMAELRALQAKGVTVDVADAPLAPDAFYQRCAAAWLVWSPEGFGWDCFRHYEAPGCGSVPLINAPQIDRHRPLLDGVHALYYEPEPGGLTRAVEAALADKPALTRIAAEGQAHVMAHHTPRAIAAYILAEGRALKGTS